MALLLLTGVALGVAVARASVEVVAVAPAPSLTPTPSESPASTPRPTASPTPTPTPTPIATASSTSAASPTPTPTPTADAAGVFPGEVPALGSGVLVVAGGSQEAPEGAAREISVRVEVEEGLAVAVDVFADYVMSVLNDPRGWPHDGSVAFSRTEGAADFRVVLATGSTVDALCAPLRTAGYYSCGRAGAAVLNAARFAGGSPPFLDAGGTIEEYRAYLVNHEVGHLLGYPHVTCPAVGGLAPTMLQQSIDLAGCLPNGWPSLDP